MTLLEAVRATIRRLHYSPRTEEAYVHWIREFLRFHPGRHPRQMGAEEVTAFLNQLALLFLYKRVLELDIPRLEGLAFAKKPAHLPAVLSRQETMALLDRLAPPFRLIAELLYGSGLHAS